MLANGSKKVSQRRERQRVHLTDVSCSGPNRGTDTKVTHRRKSVCDATQDCKVKKESQEKERKKVS